MIVLNNLFTILNNSTLFISFILSGILGYFALSSAIQMCGNGCTLCKIMKYLSALLSIGLISNFFMILLEPALYLQTDISTYIIKISIIFVIVWTFLYEMWELRTVSQTEVEY